MTRIPHADRRFAPGVDPGKAARASCSGVPHVGVSRMASRVRAEDTIDASKQACANFTSGTAFGENSSRAYSPARAKGMERGK